MRHLSLFLLLLAGLTLPRHAAAQALRWERSFGGSATSLLCDSKPTPDGGYVVCGMVRAGRGGDVSDTIRCDTDDAWLIKYDAQGTQQWDRRFGGELGAVARSVTPTSDGGYLLGCYSLSTGQATTGSNDQSEPGRGYEDYWAIKLDAQGRKQWDHRFGSDREDILQRTWQVADGGYLLAGTSQARGATGDKTAAGRGSSDYWIVRLDAQGRKLWDRTLGGSNGERLGDAIPTADGGCLLGGVTNTPGNGDVSEPATGPVAISGDYWLVKLDAFGAKEWDHRYGGNQNDQATALYQNADGSLLVAGQSSSGVSGMRTEPSRGSVDYWVLKLTAQGLKIWDHRFGTADPEAPAWSILPAAGGGYLVLGSTTGGANGDKSEPSRGFTDYWLLRLSATGTKLWDRTYGTAANDNSQRLMRLASGDLLVTGISGATTATGFSATGDRTLPLQGMSGDGWAVRLDSAGVKRSDRGTAGYADETQRAVLRTRDGGLLAVGVGQNSPGYDQSNVNSGSLGQYWLLKRDSLGAALWDTTLHLIGRGQFRPVAQELPTGELLVAGTARLTMPGTGTSPTTPYPIDADFLAYRLSARGRVQWRQEWGGPGEDWLAEARPTADGGCALGGTSRSGIGDDKTEPSRGSADFWLLKLDAARAKQWDHRYGGTGLDSLVSVRPTPDGGYMLAGSTTSPVSGDVTEPGRGGADYWLVKVNGLGVLQWQHRYGGPAHDWLASARPTADGGYILAGTTSSGIGGEVTEPARGRRDLWVVKVNQSGSIEWQRRYGGSGNEYAASLEADPDGGYLVGASTSSPLDGAVSQASRGGTDYWLLRLGAGGGVLWDQRLGGAGEDLLASATPTRGYGYALGGTSNSPAGGEHQQAGRGGYDYWTLLLEARRVPAPVILSLTPGLGLPGTLVTLVGTGFTGTSGVTFNGTPAPGFVVGPGGTTLTLTVPAGASTGPLTVTANGTGASATPFVVPVDLVISAAQTVQGTYRHVTVTGPTTGGAGTGTLSGPLTVLGTLTVQDGGTLLTACQPLTGSGSFALLAGGTLGICDPAGISASGATGAVQVNGARSFSPDASYAYTGSAAQNTGPGLPAQVRNLSVSNATGLTLNQALAVAQVVRLSSGNLTTNGHPLTLLSSLAGTALVDNTGGVVLGSATVQRFVSPVRNAGSGYRHFAAPISTATVASLTTAGFTPAVNAAYNSSATPGLVAPFPTVYSYDQGRLAASPASGFSLFDRGWVSPTQLAAPLAVGQGYTVHLPANQTVQFTGPLTNGPVTQSLGRASAPAVAAAAGWHLLGNPYPSPLDWTLLAKPTTIDDALFVFESSGPYAGTYRACVNGLGGSSLIGSGTGFFVRVNTPGATPALRFTNAARFTAFGTEPALGRGAADARPVLQLTLQDARGSLPADALFVYFEAGATPSPDARYDAVKLANPTGLHLASLAGSQELAIDGRPLLGALPLTVPLALALPQPGGYIFTTEQLVSFAPGTAVYLLDALAGTRQLLVAGGRYPFTTATTTAPGRFALEFRPATVTATAGAFTAMPVQLFPNPTTGRFTLQLPAASGPQPAQALTLTLSNSLGQPVLTHPLPAAPAGQARQVVIDARYLPDGLYLLHLRLGNEHSVQRLLIQH